MRITVHASRRPGGDGWFSFVRRAAKDRAQVLLVEKPGVKLFDAPANPGGGSECSETFRRELSGERWLVAIKAAMTGIRSLHGMAPRSTLVPGHSEGGVMALRLPMVAPGRDACRGPEQHMANLLDSWNAIRKEPASDTKQVYGHPYRYWTGKYAPVYVDRIAGSGARIFLAYGGVALTGAASATGMQSIIERGVAWFLGMLTMSPTSSGRGRDLPDRGLPRSPVPLIRGRPDVMCAAGIAS